MDFDEYEAPLQDKSGRIHLTKIRDMIKGSMDATITSHERFTHL
ncbi:hypothetical protein ACI8B_280139 [Acinetobacter proteolyticus]|uniref:Uncharacterized protein n=1 Tax=Acinetobacter proteolyticus TaxID=1776741 RepID=A0A653K625_9GAMM|nr:hypothetical protein ACI8B_280139 [Acinetobacter proteolyticus]